jgi:hypothetical protein
MLNASEETKQHLGAMSIHALWFVLARALLFGCSLENDLSRLHETRPDFFAGLSTGLVIIPNRTSVVKAFGLDFLDQFAWSFVLVGVCPTRRARHLLGPVSQPAW